MISSQMVIGVEDVKIDSINSGFSPSAWVLAVAIAGASFGHTAGKDRAERNY